MDGKKGGGRAGENNCLNKEKVRGEEQKRTGGALEDRFGKGGRMVASFSAEEGKGEPAK